MKATLAWFGVTMASWAATVTKFLGEYSGALTGLAACVTIICGIRTLLKKDKQ